MIARTTPADLRVSGGRAARRRVRGALLAAAFLAVGGCTAPTYMSRQIDKGQAAITRGINDVVDAADRAFGDPRISDREQLVQAKIGGAVRTRQNSGTTLALPVSARLPLPAAERRANIFLSVDSMGDPLSKTRDAASSLDANRAVSAGLITRVTQDIHTGVRFDLFWDQGAQTGAHPFLRWEWQRDPFRVYVEQQVYERTEKGLGEQTTVELTLVFEQTGFLRFLTSMDANRHDPGITYENSLLYRRLVPSRELALSAELGVVNNPYSGNPGTATPGAANDPDEVYFQVRATGKVYRPWLEYEVTPSVHVPWEHRDALELGITVELRCVYESFLHGPAGGPPAATPSPQPN